MAGGDGHAGIVTRGAEGVMLAAPDGTLYEGVLYVRGRYPVGSGDAFLAGLVTALERGSDWEDALRLALGAGAANAELAGAARLEPSRAEALASRRTCTSSSRMRVEPFVEDDWAAFREIRLRSLLDSPDAFGSTYGEESSHAEPAWRDWAAGRWRGGTALAFAARDRDGAVVGTATGAEYEAEPGVGHLYAMWVAPDARGAGVGARARGRGRRMGACARMRPARPLGHRDERGRTPLLRGVRVRRHRRAAPAPRRICPRRADLREAAVEAAASAAVATLGRMRRPAAAAISPATAVIGLFLTFGLIVASFFPFLSVYFAGRGFDPGEIGLLLSAMALVRIVAMPVWGHVADTRIGRKRALQLGLIGMVVFAIVATLLDTLVGVAFGAVGIAIAMAASGPNIDALALVQLGEERMSEYGRIRGWESLSYAAGCLAFGWVLDIHGVTLALPLYAATGALMLVWTTIAVRSDRPQRSASTTDASAPWARCSGPRRGSGASSWRRSSSGPDSTRRGTSSV